MQGKSGDRNVSERASSCCDRFGSQTNMPCMSLFLFMPPLQAYTDELVELHRRLMALRERNVLQQVEIICQLSGKVLYSGKLRVQGSQVDPCDSWPFTASPS